MDLSPQEHLGSFEIVSLLGKGGMGAVYLARDLELGRNVAIKVFRSDVFSDPSGLERFKHEARSASALNHPNIVTIYEIGSMDDVHYLVMEYVTGPTLRELLTSGPVEPAELFRIGTQMADGLGKAHRAGIVHRDLKPENVMLTEDGLVKILDFGLAKLVDTGEPQERVQAPTQQVTEVGVVLGTVTYMSPEQLSAAPVDARSDQFSLGTILYEMATGRRPFERPSTVQTIAAIMQIDPEPLVLHLNAPSTLSSLIQRMLAKSPDDRFDSVNDVRERLIAMSGAPMSTMRSTSNISGGTSQTPARLPAFLSESAGEVERFSHSLFVGRDSERARLTEKLSKARAGAGQLVFITGEPGSGKTMLLREFARSASDGHENLVAAVGHCNAQTGTGDPYLPFREVVHAFTGDVQARREAGAMSRAHALRLWHLLPTSLGALLEEGPDLIETLVGGRGLAARAAQYPCPLENRRRLDDVMERKAGEQPGAGVHQNAILDQATAFFQSLARERTVLLVFEDIHWADAGTIAMLCHLCQHIDGHAIMLVASYRPGELTAPEGQDRHPLESARLELKRKYGDFEIRVDDASGREFVDALIDATPTRLDAGFRDALHRQTQGHPLFTVELLRDLRERKAIIKDGDGREVLSQPVDWQALPIKAEAVIAERIGRLPQQLQRVLKVASVEGEDLTAEVVARIEDIDEREMIRLLSEEADKRHQLVRALDVRRAGRQRLSVYRFRHILFQKYLYQSLDRVERSYLHEAVGNTLETLLGNRADDAAVRLAHHFREASVPEKAFHYLALSGDKARRAYATKEATQIYSQAIAVAEEIDFEVDQARLMGVYEGRGHVSMSLTRFDDAIADFGAMRSAAKEAGDLQNEAEALSQTAYCYFLKMGDDHIPAMEQCAKDALTLAEKTGDQNILSRSLTTLGIVHETRGELAAAIEKLEASRAICLKEGFKGALVQNLFHLGQQAYWQGNFAGAVPIAKEGVAAAEELRDGFHELFNRAVLCLSTWGCGEYGEAFDVLEESLRKARETENRFLEGRLVNTQGWFHRDLGDFRGAVEFHEQGLALAKSVSVFNVEISALVDLGHDYLALGRLGRAMDYLEPTLERVENEGIGSHRWRWTVRLLNMIAEVHFAAGRPEEAARFNALGLEKARATSSAKYEASALALRAKLRSVHGEKETPEKDFGQAMALARKLQSPTILIPIAHDFGTWCDTAGDEASAAALYGEAKSAIDAISSSIRNDRLRSVFESSELVKTVHEC